MKKLGFGKHKDADESSQKTGLFGRKHKKDKETVSPAPSPYSINPYAVGEQPLDPYGQEKKRLAEKDAYNKQQAEAAKKANAKSPSGNASGPRPGGEPVSPRPGYGPNQANKNGYGQDPYGGKEKSPAPRYAAGGYGGLGMTDPNAVEERNALFGDAQDRHKDRQENSGRPGYPGGSPEAPPPDYQPYEERQLTAEEEEEQDVEATKNEIKYLKQETVSSTRNALAAAHRAEETGRDTLTRLGAQGERLHDTEKNLNVAENENRIAQDKARELARVNRSMFAAVHVSNPFTTESRRRKHEQNILDRHQEERYAREAARMDAYRSGQRMNEHFKEVNKKGKDKDGANNTVDRSKYQFEADSDDEHMEDEIEGNVKILEGAAGRLNALARAAGSELSSQNNVVDRIGVKSDSVDDQLRLNRDRLDRIR